MSTTGDILNDFCIRINARVSDHFSVAVINARDGTWTVNGYDSKGAHTLIQSASLVVAERYLWRLLDAVDPPYEGEEPQELTWENDGVTFHMVES